MTNKQLFIQEQLDQDFLCELSEQALTTQDWSELEEEHNEQPCFSNLTIGELMESVV